MAPHTHMDGATVKNRVRPPVCLNELPGIAWRLGLAVANAGAVRHEQQDPSRRQHNLDQARDFGRSSVPIRLLLRG
jgi:hypothetical protein